MFENIHSSTETENQLLPLHLAQKEIYNEQIIEPTNSQFNIGGYIFLRGALDKELFLEAVKGMSTFFDIFQLKLYLQGENPYCTFSRKPADVKVLELNLENSPNPSEEGISWMKSRFNKVFDIRKNELYEIYLLRISPTEHFGYIRCHHLLTDGYGFGIMTQHVLTRYSELLSSKKQDLKISQAFGAYENELISSFEYLRTDSFKKDLLYWKNKFKTVPEPLFESKTRETEVTKLGRLSFKVDGDILHKINGIISSTGSSLQQLTLAALTIYFGRLEGRSEVVLGVPLHKRRNKLQRKTLGPFSGVVPFKYEYKANCSVKSFLEGIRLCQRMDYRYQNVPTSYINKELNLLAKGKRRLFDIIVNYEPINFSADLDELDIEVNHLASTDGSIPLTIRWCDYSENRDLELKVDYGQSYFSETEAELLVNRILFIIQQFDEVNMDLSSIQILPPAEKDMIAIFSNSKISNYYDKESIIDLFKETAILNQKMPAICFEEVLLTYGDLLDYSNQFANFLDSQGVKEGDIVAVCLERGAFIIPCLLGIWKCGAAYLPIDVFYPDERKHYMIENSNSRLLIDNQFLNQFLQERHSYSKKERNISYSNSNLAYMMYTSGSTGKPKGVLITHYSVLNYILSFKNHFGLTDKDRVIHQSSLSFDTHVEEIFPCLISGGLVVVSKEGSSDLFALGNQIKEQKATILSTTPLVLQEMNKMDLDYSSLRLVITGGDLVRMEYINQILKQVDVVNTYGPTETTVVATSYNIKKGDIDIPIGRPMRHAKVYILNSDKEMLPIGAIGEIYIGGTGVSLGYHNQDELSSEKFLKDFFSNDKVNSRMYRTGDLGRWLESGEIEFLGRSDDQIKIRGRRIELGEIESVLYDMSCISQCFVSTSKDNNDQIRLICYVVGSSELDRDKINRHLRLYLPNHMIPSIILILESLPMLPNGKIDRQKLPNPGSSMPLSETSYFPPSNYFEEKLVLVWQKVLQVEKIGVLDNFFELGGHSLLVTRLVSAIRKTFAKDIVVKDVFQNPTILELANFLSLSINELTYPELISHTNTTGIPLSFAQERLWFLNQFEGSNVAYLVPRAIKFIGDVNTLLIKKTLSIIIQKHEILRTVFKNKDGEPYQEILSNLNFVVNEFSYENYPDSEKNSKLQQFIRKEGNTPFNIQEGPLIRVHLVKFSKTESVLVLCEHHLIHDGWTQGVLLKEFIDIYQKLFSNDEYTIVPPKIQFKDYAYWEKEYLTGDVLEKKLKYWELKLKDSLSTIPLPTDRMRPKSGSGKGGILTEVLDEDFSLKLREFSKNYGLTLFMTMLGAFKILLSKLSGEPDISVGTGVANRKLDGIDEMLGMVINTMVLRTNINANLSLIEVLRDVRQTCLEAYEYEDTPFGKVVERLNPKREEGLMPLFQYLFSFMNTPSRNLELSELEVEILDSYNSSSKFDLDVIVITPQEQNNLEGISIDNNDIIIEWEYNADLFLPETMERMFNMYIKILKSIISDPQCKISDLDMVLDSEKETINLFGSGKQLEYSGEISVVDLFEKQVEQTPNNIAVVDQKEELTYAELNGFANQLANYLNSNFELEPEDIIAIQLERCVWSVVSTLAILKLGCAYLPIDSGYPEDRVGFMCQDSNSKILLDGTLLSSFIDSLDDWSNFNPIRRHTLDNLAYVIYTSGTSGRPKGVQIEHKSLLNICSAWPQEYEINSRTNFLQISSFSFDVFAGDLFRSLLNGARLVICPFDMLLDSEKLYHFLKEYEIHILDITPKLAIPHFEYFFENELDISFLRVLILGSDILPSADFKLLMERYAGVFRIINCYGTTETTIDSTCFECSRDYLKNLNSPNVPIGRPMANTSIYILDSVMCYVPVGVYGELYIGGVQVARGYLNRPELTRERFISDPYSDVSGARLYRTGDMARWLPDGNIEFLGRLDNQVKIRGHRIELGEIEAVLCQLADVSQSVVSAVDDGHGQDRLVGYVVVDGDFDRSSIEEHLRTHLPDYMVPSLLVPLDSLPLTSNGKVDRKALPSPDFSLLLDGVHTPASTLSELELVSIWEDLLGVNGIGVTDDFFELGGHSLLVSRMVSRIRNRLSKELSIRDVFIHSTIQSLSHFLDDAQEGNLLPELVRMDRPDRIPLSFSQEQLWIIDKLEGSLHYHMSTVFQIQGDLDLEALSFSFSSTVDRHEILRTVYKDSNGIGYQEVLETGLWEMGYMKLSEGRSPAEESALVSTLIGEPFDLSRDHMLRATLISLSSEEYLLVLVLHHIAADGWSVPILINELATFYGHKKNSLPLDLPELSVQYSDYSLWQRSYLQEDILSSKLSYWESKLSGVEVLELPLDHSRPILQSIKGATLTLDLSADLRDGAEALSKKLGGTLFMTLLSIFKVLLYRHSGQSDICVGSPMGNRTHGSLEQLIGFFVNTLPLRSNLAGNPSFEELFKDVRRTCLEAYHHQDAPFEKIVERTHSTRDLGRSPIFQVVFALDTNDTVEVGPTSFGGLELVRQEHSGTVSKFDLTFNMVKSNEGLLIRAEYCTDLFSESTIERMMGHYQEILSSVIEDSTQQIGHVSMLTPSERQQLLLGFNDTQVDYPKDKTVVDIFEEQAAMNPDNMALSFGDENMTYRELDQKSNQLARHLRNLGVREESLVGICLERSMNMIVGMLGILKAGGAYVPIDPDYPLERIKFMVDDIKAGVLLSDVSSQGKLTGDTVLIDGHWESIRKQSKETLNIQISPNNLMYVIYTSGSTGKPKGVLIEHRNVVRLFKTDSPLFNFNSKDIWTMFHSFCFDFSIWEIYGALLHGAKLVIVPKSITRNTSAFAQLLHTEKITVLNQTPSAFYVLQEFMIANKKSIDVRYLIFGGEALDFTKLEPWANFYQDCQLINMYGITETTVHVTYQEIEESMLSARIGSVIGKAIPTLSVCVLDDNQQLLPAGIPGELCIGGTGLARGYLNNPKLTEERFISNPFGEGCLYRSGDLGRLLPDGNIEYLGRLDDQVKLNGYRIELGEIESVLNQSGIISQCVVVTGRNKNGDKKLIGYVVPIKNFEKEVIMGHLVNHLPEYMVPNIWIPLEAIPLTSNGKVDKNALLDFDTIGQLSCQYVSPRNDVERTLVDIWKELLAVEHMGIHDNFFEQGGHSLLAMQMVSAIRSELSYEIELIDIFRMPTIYELGNHLDKGDLSLSNTVIQPHNREQLIPLAYSQKSLWFIDKTIGSVQEHFSLVLNIKGNLDIKHAEKCFQEIVNRHEILRTVIEEIEGIPYQYIKSRDAWNSVYLEKEACQDFDKWLDRFIKDKVNAPFDLSKDSLFRLTIIKKSKDRYVLVIVFHHIIFDGWSLRLLVEEFKELYESVKKNRTATLPNLNIQYADYSLWQNSEAAESYYKLGLEYWKNKLNGVKRISLPFDAINKSNDNVEGVFYFELEEKLKIKSFCNQNSVTLYMLILACLKVLLYKYTGQNDICIGSPIANRNRKEVEPLIGFFLNTLAMRSKININKSISHFLSEIKNTTLEAYKFQEVPFEKVLELNGVKPKNEHNGFFSVVLNMLNFSLPEKIQIDGLDITSSNQTGISKSELSWYFTEKNDLVSGVIRYDRSKFNPQRIEGMSKHFIQLLTSIVINPSQLVSELQYLSNEELEKRDDVLKDFLS